MSSNDSLPNQLDAVNIIPNEPVVENGPICRYCGDEAVEDLFESCECRGSMAHVHIECLRLWVEQRIKNGAAEPLVCEVCHQPYRVEARLEYKLQCGARCSWKKVVLSLLYVLMLAAISVALIFPFGILIILIFPVGMIVLITSWIYSCCCVPVVTLRRLPAVEIANVQEEVVYNLDIPVERIPVPQPGA